MFQCTKGGWSAEGDKNAEGTTLTVICTMRGISEHVCTPLGCGSMVSEAAKLRSVTSSRTCVRRKRFMMARSGSSRSVYLKRRIERKRKEMEMESKGKIRKVA